MARIYVGSYGMLSIQDDEALQARLTALRTRVAGNAARKPIGKQIFSALLDWQRAVREAVKTQHGLTTLAEYQSYALESVPLEALIEAEQLNAAGKATAQAQGPTYQCRIYSCQNRTRTPGGMCGQCEHDA